MLSLGLARWKCLWLYFFIKVWERKIASKNLMTKHIQTHFSFEMCTRGSQINGHLKGQFGSKLNL
jgi:hypothetical protein